MKIYEINKKSLFGTVIFLLLVLVGGYILFNVLYPRIHLTANLSKENPEVKGTNTSPTFPGQIPVREVDKLLIIPKIHLTEGILQDGKSSLNKGLWHKFPERSDPEKGGNFVITGHRFTFGLTVDETLRKSPLYNVDQLGVGDLIKVKWEGKMYEYKIYSIKEVPKTAVEIEKQTRQDILTLYTCTFLGDDGPRLVIRATPL